MNTEMEKRMGMHAELCDFLKDLHRRKNIDYGDSFHQSYLEEGKAMIRIRLGDKLNRFKELSRKNKEEQLVNDESMRDTLLDLANYALMAVVEMDYEAESEKKRDKGISSHGLMI